MSKRLLDQTINKLLTKQVDAIYVYKTVEHEAEIRYRPLTGHMVMLISQKMLADIKNWADRHCFNAGGTSINTMLGVPVFQNVPQEILVAQGAKLWKDTRIVQW